MAMYWTNERLNELITQFRAHPVLWDPKNSKYRDRPSKSRAWDDIASNMRVERYICERKMNILRTQFRREWNRKKFSLMNGKSAKESKWYAYRSLQFLEGVEQRGFRHRFNQQVDNLSNIASVLQIQSKWPNINKRFQHNQNMQLQLEKAQRINNFKYSEQMQNVKCETLSNPDDDNEVDATANETLKDEYPQDYSLKDHHQSEVEEHDMGDNVYEDQETINNEENISELNNFNQIESQNNELISASHNMQCVSPNNVYGQATNRTNSTMEKNNLVYQIARTSTENIDKHHLGQPSDLSVHSLQFTSTPEKLLIQPYSLTVRQTELVGKPEVTFTQLNRSISHNISTHSHVQPNAITSYSNISISQPNLLSTNSVQAHSNNTTQNITTQPVRPNILSKHLNTNSSQINVDTSQISTIHKSNNTVDRPQSNQPIDNTAAKPNVKVCPRRSSTSTTNIRNDQSYPTNSSQWRPTNNLRFRRRALMSRLRNNNGSFENDDLTDVIRLMVREEVQNSAGNTGTVRDESISYGEHVGFRLQRLSPRARSIVTHLIDGILYEADMGTYDVLNNSSARSAQYNAVKQEGDNQDLN